MLVVTRREDEGLKIGDDIVIRVKKGTSSNSFRILVIAPKQIPISRISAGQAQQEILNAVARRDTNNSQ